MTKGDEGYGGFAIDLWEGIATKLTIPFEYKHYSTVPSLLQALRQKEVDIAVTNLTISQERLLTFDFTQPWFDRGLRIMINEDRRTGLWEIARKLGDAGFLRVYAWIALSVVVATVVLTVVDRKFDPEFAREWHKGLAESFYHVISVVTSGRTAHKELFGVVGRVFSALWMVAGVAIVAYVTSTVTSVMTASTLTNQINSISDLPGKKVAVVQGTASEAVANDMGFWVQPYESLPAAVNALVRKQVSSVIGDAPVLEYYDATHPELPITEVGAIFHPEKYGFGMPFNSEMLRPINRQIVAMQESGSLARLRSKYFGTAP